MTTTIKPQEVIVHPDGSVQITFMSPFSKTDGRPPGAEHLPVGHCIHPSAFYHRALSHNLDHTHPAFIHDVVRLCLHEAHTPAPPHILTDSRYRYGEVFDLAAADAVIDWQFTDAHKRELEKVNSFIDRNSIVEQRESRRENVRRMERIRAYHERSQR